MVEFSPLTSASAEFYHRHAATLRPSGLAARLDSMTTLIVSSTLKIAGHAGRSPFAKAVRRNEIRTDAPGSPKFGKRNLHRRECWLDKFSAIQSGVSRYGQQLVEQRPSSTF